MVEQAPLKRKVTGSSPVWPTLLLLLWSPPGHGAAGLEVPKGTVLAVELVDPVHSAKNKAGDSFRARASEGVWLRGRVAVPPGTTLRGLVTEATPSGRIKGQARLSITLYSLELEGRSYSLQTDTLTYVGEAHTGKHLGSWLTGALQGALYGVLFGGKEGAILGAGAGAGAGAAASVLTGKMDVDFSQGAKLMFETLESVLVPEPPPAPPASKAEEKAPAKEVPKEAPKPEAKPST